MTRRPGFCAVPPVSFSPAVFAPSLDTRSMVVYRPLRDKGVEHGGVKIANPVHHDSTVVSIGRGNTSVLNPGYYKFAVVKVPYEFNPVQLDVQHGKPDANIGTLPFLALDLLNECSLDGMVQRRLYRHDAESFTWCLIYICVCMEKDLDGRIGTQNPHPLSPWSEDPARCSHSKNNLVKSGLPRFPLHQSIRPLVAALFTCWMEPFQVQRSHDLSAQASLELAGIDEGGHISWLLPPDLVEPKKAVLKTEPYEELPPQEWFKRVFRLLLQGINFVPRSRVDVFVELVNLVATLYPFVKPVGRRKARAISCSHLAHIALSPPTKPQQG